MDLKEVELGVLNAKIRPSKFDNAVKVLEFHSRVNALNVERLLDLLESLEHGKKPFVVWLATGDCFIDEVAKSAIRTRHRQPRETPTGFIGFPQRVRFAFRVFSGDFEAANEKLAVIQALRLTPSAGPNLIKFLADNSPDARLAAAKALGDHHGETGVAEALLSATKDDRAEVRAASILSLAKTGSLLSDVGAGIAQNNHASEPASKVVKTAISLTQDNDPAVRAAVAQVLQRSSQKEATLAVISLFRDSQETVRIAAARAAASRPLVQIEDPLIGLLEDPMPKVAAAAVTSLGRLKSKRAIPHLQALETRFENRLAGAVADALLQLGVLTPVEAAIRKLGVARLSSHELRALAEAKERRAVQKLIEIVETEKITDSDIPWYSDSEKQVVVEVLGDIGDAAAVEPLINLLQHPSGIEECVPLALAKLGDTRAINPLLRAVGRTSRGRSDRRAIYEALLMLDAPGTFDKLVAKLGDVGRNYDANETLRVLGRAGGDGAVPVIAGYLDDPRACQIATQALLENGSDQALDTIRQRLLDEDYGSSRAALAAVPSIISASYRHATRDEANEQAMWRALSLLHETRHSRNALFRSYVGPHLDNLANRLAELNIQKCATLVNSRNFDEADEEFLRVVEQQLESSDDDTRGHPRIVLALLNPMTDAYRRADGVHRADQLLTKVIETVESSAENTKSEELKDLLLQLQAIQRTRQIRGGTQMDQSHLEQLQADLAAMLRRKLETGLIPSDLDALKHLGMALEENSEFRRAAEFYEAAINVVDKPADKQVLALLQTMRAATRRLGMIGKTLSIAGTTPEGAAYDSTLCRGKVLLVDFWLPWNSKCRQQLPNVKRLYRRYHHRGFEVVAICPGTDQMKKPLERALAQNDLPWTILFDGDKAVATRLGILSIPTSILLDGDGKVVSLGASGYELSKCLERLLGKPYEQRWKAPPYSTERVNFVDLALHANQPLAKTTFAGWEGNNLAEVPKGEQTMAGVPFLITDQLIQLRGVHLENMPQRINDIAIEKSFRTLYVLHGTQWGTGRFHVEHGTVIGEIIVRYSDAQSLTIPITYGENVRDWWNADHSKPTKFGAIAWDGVNAASKARNATIRLYVTAWDNPHQDKEVRAIDYVSNNTVSAPFCVAISIK